MSLVPSEIAQEHRVFIRPVDTDAWILISVALEWCIVFFLIFVISFYWLSSMNRPISQTDPAELSKAVSTAHVITSLLLGRKCATLRAPFLLRYTHQDICWTVLILRLRCARCVAHKLLPLAELFTFTWCMSLAVTAQTNAVSILTETTQGNATGSAVRTPRFFVFLRVNIDNQAALGHGAPAQLQLVGDMVLTLSEHAIYEIRALEQYRCPLQIKRVTAIGTRTTQRTQTFRS
mmetsp:Transcript_80752/g.158535  ORF Transcript_80752/g.158535 Transcript_80752/m.158535 type:complete len:234 (-) Transcript_80752:909-1610(-)